MIISFREDLPQPLNFFSKFVFPEIVIRAVYEMNCDGKQTDVLRCINIAGVLGYGTLTAESL